jgi:hypothetical protein
MSSMIANTPTTIPIIPPTPSGWSAAFERATTYVALARIEWLMRLVSEDGGRAGIVVGGCEMRKVW